MEAEKPSLTMHQTHSVSKALKRLVWCPRKRLHSMPGGVHMPSGFSGQISKSVRRLYSKRHMLQLYICRCPAHLTGYFKALSYVMPHLPVEILDQIIRDLPFRYGQKLAPLATINRHWQSAVEAILWRHIQVTTADIDLFSLFYQTRTRRQAVKHIVFNAQYFEQLAEQESTSGDDDVADYGKPDYDENTGGDTIQKEDELVNTEPRCDRNKGSYQSARHLLSAVQAEHFRFFHDTSNLWVTLARAEVKSIRIIVDGYSLYEHLGLKFRDHDGFQTSLCAKDWLEQCPTLPVLLQL
ncbi:uncharacterized protein EKO05_0007732 [Ascochyta rabiei]|uniref:uncharacterized protein n=1 Tax=Didymella rabiei TaxID=5454 RepID=UPI00220E35BD|nr:uncharacterized protein EKO05_0007732 [Ascochyta rabiei]UPX17371.1 hypothetical protein EKO05_0007732 [Ascochyta rabiei]